MAEKKPYSVVTFHTTTGAMHTEKVCKDNKLEGRLIPVPRVISAGCGLAWREPTDNRDKLVKVLKSANIDYNSIVELEL